MGNNKVKIDKKKKYKVNVIYSYEEKEQDFCDIYVNEWDLMNKENFLKKLSVGILEKDEILQLVKISTCVYQTEKMSKQLHNYLFDEKEGWFIKYNGKFYIQGGDFSTIYHYFGISESIKGGKYGERIIEQEEIDGKTIVIEKLEYFPSPTELVSFPLDSELKEWCGRMEGEMN